MSSLLIIHSSITYKLHRRSIYSLLIQQDIEILHLKMSSISTLSLFSCIGIYELKKKKKQIKEKSHYELNSFFRDSLRHWEWKTAQNITQLYTSRIITTLTIIKQKEICLKSFQKNYTFTSANMTVLHFSWILHNSLLLF